MCSGSNLTRNSLMIENLAIAADDPLCTHEIMGEIFDEIAQHILDRSRKSTSDNGQNDDSYGGVIEETYSSFIDDNFYLYEVAIAIQMEILTKDD